MAVRLALVTICDMCVAVVRVMILMHTRRLGFRYVA